MDYLSIIKNPIEAELADFISLFNQSLSHEDGLLGSALEHIRKRAGKRMRPMLILLMAKNFGTINEATQNAAVGLELLHTASLVHDDVVDESEERRGQASVNATYDNKVAVLVGDYILSTALLCVARTHSEQIVTYLAELGRTLSDGEILQLSNIGRKDISEDVYYDVIKQKTAALFEACAGIGALSSGATEEDTAFGVFYTTHLFGIIYELRYLIGTHRVLLHLQCETAHVLVSTVIYSIYDWQRQLALNHIVARRLANLRRVVIVKYVVAYLEDDAKVLAEAGSEYAERRMWEFHDEACHFIDTYIHQDDIRQALRAYLDYVIKRNK